MMRCIKAGLLLLGVHWLAAPALSCPLCKPGPLFRKDFAQARVVLFGKFTNPRLAKGNALSGGSSDFVVEKVLKGKEVLGDSNVLNNLGRYIPKSQSKYLIFCNVAKGKIDPYRGAEIFKNGDPVQYLKGNLALKGKPVPVRLRYCFDYLDNPEFEIAQDAYREFALADYKDCRAMARKLPPEKVKKLAGWLTNAKTPSYHLGLYALLLGDCGKTRDAQLLRRLLNDPKKRKASGADGMLVSYTLLQPTPGWSFLRDRVLGRPEEPWSTRYAGLRAARFLWDFRSDVIKKKELLEGFCRMLNHPDMADLVIEDLRKWQCWEVSGRVVALATQDAYNYRGMRRAILRYALCCPPKYTKAAEFVKRERRRNKEEVADVEEMLKMDGERPPR
jgi:hypothetical protein